MSGERCPKCGIELNTPYGSGCHPEDGFTCRERQLVQRDKRIRELEAEVERLKDIIEAMYSCGTRTGVEELYAEYNKEVMGDE